MIAEERQVCLLVIHPTLNVMPKPDRVNCSPVVSHVSLQWQQVRWVLSTDSRKQGFCSECCVLQISGCLVGVLLSLFLLYYDCQITSSPPSSPELPLWGSLSVSSSFCLGLRKEEERKVIRVGFCLVFF